MSSVSQGNPILKTQTPAPSLPPKPQEGIKTAQMILLKEQTVTIGPSLLKVREPKKFTFSTTAIERSHSHYPYAYAWDDYQLAEVSGVLEDETVRLQLQDRLEETYPLEQESLKKLKAEKQRKKQVKEDRQLTYEKTREIVSSKYLPTVELLDKPSKEQHEVSLSLPSKRVIRKLIIRS